MHQASYAPVVVSPDGIRVSWYSIFGRDERLINSYFRKLPGLVVMFDGVSTDRGKIWPAAKCKRQRGEVSCLFDNSCLGMTAIA